MLKFFRLLLFPFSLLFALVVRLRVVWCAKRRKSALLPSIVVGNLTTGGTGKTPHALYIAELLLQHGKEVAMLSRGYGRKTKGFIEVREQAAASQVGDEPLMMKQRFPELPVFVCEKRVEGIQKIGTWQNQHNKKLDCVVLDDAFQHLALLPDLAIVLLTYASLQEPWILLPAGNAREPLSALERAEIIIVTKCPNGMDNSEKARMKNRIAKNTQAPVFFSTYRYLGLIGKYGQKVSANTSENCVLVAGLANPSDLVAWLKNQFAEVKTVLFPDHHLFSRGELEQIVKNNPAHFIVISEKDRVRIQEVWPGFLEKENVLTIAIHPDLGEERYAFEELLLSKWREFKI